MTSFLLNLRFVGRGAASSRLRLIDNTVFNGDWNHSQNGCVIDIRMDVLLTLLSNLDCCGCYCRTYCLAYFECRGRGSGPITSISHTLLALLNQAFSIPSTLQFFSARDS